MEYGAKVTIDSASMMNKGFEMIEAHWLFNVSPDDIQIVVHPESIVHSMVQFRDGSVKAQLGCPDMRLPIQYALSYPYRLPLDVKRLDFATLSALHFEAPDFEKFPSLRLAYESIRRGGNAPCAMNAANEEAVKALVEERLAFWQIPLVVEKALEQSTFIQKPDLDAIYSTNFEVQKIASQIISSL
jgi:1-deoxy-D-xylulose 5-phosphate reductoisomerase